MFAWATTSKDKRFKIVVKFPPMIFDISKLSCDEVNNSEFLQMF